ncbi:hypothetical protein QO231_20875 [Sedimentitalea todarodis]|uniref:Glycosyl transferase family 2 n=2 Tax=Sedimentitalea todarodis TaxID=1631240 RepID=A0ABU3VJG5_9RHOB|nr:hypothetical protein [Sedimentitalea todarodis]
MAGSGMLSFATIVYSKDYPLLELQARSMARFLDPAEVASISIIMNEVDEPALRRNLSDILPYYGPLASHVRIVGGDDILLPANIRTSPRALERAYVDYRYRIPAVRRQGWRGNNGYRMQQALKLASARCAGSDRIVLLDAKNVFLRPLSESDFFSSDGKGRIQFLKPELVFHRNWLSQSLLAFVVGCDVDDVSETTTFVTPYPVKREVLLGVLDEIDNRFGSVQALFASKRRPSEFMLINACCIKHHGGPEADFEKAHPVNIGLWPEYDEAKVRAELNRLKDPEALSLGVHNRVVSQLGAAHLDHLLEALEDRGICTKSQARDVFQRIGAVARRQ